MIKIHTKFGNYFICENGEALAMCTQIDRAKRIKKALENTSICPHMDYRGNCRKTVWHIKCACPAMGKYNDVN